jgi:chemotaxis protein MotA
MAGKLKRRSEEELLLKEIVIRGVLLLQTGAAPSAIESNLKAYLEPAKRVRIKGA